MTDHTPERGLGGRRTYASYRPTTAGRTGPSASGLGYAAAVLSALLFGLNGTLSKYVLQAGLPSEYSPSCAAPVRRWG